MASAASPEETAKASPKYTRFHILTTPYKKVANQPIPAHILIPKELKTTTPPILVRFHGGFLITGAALYPEFTADWALEYSLLHSAIWVAPDYRLLPESNGLDILDDLHDFWAWLKNDFPNYLASTTEGKDLEPDLSRVLVYGESAGGYLAVQSALTQLDTVRAVISAFPMLEVDAPWYSVKAEGKSPFGAPEVSKSFLDKHLQDMKEGVIVTEGYPPDRIPLALVAIQQGLFTEMLGSDDRLYPLKVLEKTRADESPPFLLIFHGLDDRAVPWEGTGKFVDMWKEKFGQDSIYDYFAAGDHGLDTNDTLETAWLKYGLVGVTKAWLA